MITVTKLVVPPSMMEGGSAGSREIVGGTLATDTEARASEVRVPSETRRRTSPRKSSVHRC
ncbi:MAG: hypothetical protein E6K13_09415 [Methanobacteriota archaeon]|nr:MAG: hypothetical protein E6K13_09415 [Euryarchaeota archaeon]